MRKRHQPAASGATGSQPAPYKLAITYNGEERAPRFTAAFRETRDSLFTVADEAMTVPNATSADAMRDAVVAHFGAVLDAAVVETEPFAHFYLEGVFPDDVYARMLETMPDPGLYRSLSDKHVLEDGTSTRDVLQLDDDAVAKMDEESRPLWGGISAALRSPQLQRKIFAVFRDPLAKRFKVAPADAEDVEGFPNPAFIRDLGGYEIRPHPDSPSKVVTTQYYLPRDAAQEDLGTALYKLKILQLKNLMSPRNAFVKVKQFPFRPNSMYGFAVTRTSWHGRELVPFAAEARNTILNIYYDAPGKGY